MNTVTLFEERPADADRTVLVVPKGNPHYAQTARPVEACWLRHRYGQDRWLEVVGRVAHMSVRTAINASLELGRGGLGRVERLSDILGSTVERVIDTRLALLEDGRYVACYDETPPTTVLRVTPSKHIRVGSHLLGPPPCYDALRRRMRGYL